ncbi:MAG: restriction endonuclease subunit S [Actinomycetota bacterium]|nr:restriction endonuclease subunit S [Actinomycetota bacterium]
MAEFYDGPHATPAPADDGPVYLGIKNLSESGHLDLSQVRHIAESDFATWTRRVEPKPGDIVFTYEATLHRYAIIPDGFRGSLGRRIALIRPDESKIDRRYLHYYLLSSQWRRTIEQRINVGSTVDRIPLMEFPDYPILLPPLPHQRAVVAALGAIDDLIQNNRRRIEMLEEMARLVYGEWFVHFRFPGHEDVELVESDLGPIPDGWTVAITADLISAGTLEIGDGYRAKNSEFDGHAYAFVRVKNVGEGYLNLADVDYLPEPYGETVGGKRGRPGDCVISMKGTVGRMAFVSERTPPLIYSPQVSYWRPLKPDRLSSTYLRLWMQSSVFVEQCARVKGATDMADYVNLRDQRTMRLVLPSHSVHAAFVVAVSPLLALADNLRSQIGVLESARHLLLPRLISGELDVSDLNLDLEPVA